MFESKNVRRIMANDYNSKQNDLTSVLTNEKKLMDQLMQFMRTATHKAQNKLKHIVKRAENKISAEDQHH